MCATVTNRNLANVSCWRHLYVTVMLTNIVVVRAALRGEEGFTKRAFLSITFFFVYRFALSKRLLMQPR